MRMPCGETFRRVSCSQVTLILMAIEAQRRGSCLDPAEEVRDSYTLRVIESTDLDVGVCLCLL